MTADIQAAKEHIDELIRAADVSGTVKSEITDNEVEVTITNIPFIHHGQQFRSAVLLHFTLQLNDDGTYRTSWGKYDWQDGGTCKTENDTADHGTIETAGAWIDQMIEEHAHTGRANAMPGKQV